MLEPQLAPVSPGDVLAGKYRVIAVLGVGGMGVVVAAHHEQLGQDVAIKFLLPEGLANRQVVARFEREARAAAQLRSEHVARVIDVGHLDGGRGPYIVMELLRGVDLADMLIEKGPLPETEAVDLLLQACEAIAEAHNAGIVHRDLKPKNLFVTTRVDGTPLVKVLDFGISKTKAEDLSLTATAEVIGSPNYMSPEQLKASRDVDARSDIWSIGVILYELLGGRVPFVAQTLTQLCSMVLTEPPEPLETLRPDLHPELRRVVTRCLEKSPAARFQNVGELAMALAPFASAAGSALATRVAVVAGTSSGSLPPPTYSSGRVLVPGQSTSVTWDATELARTAQGSKRALFAGAAAGAVLVGGVAATLLFATSTPQTPSNKASGGNAPIATAVVAPAPASAASVTVAPQATASTSPEVTHGSEPAAGTSTATTPRPPAVGKTPTKRVIQRANGSGDDLPSDRK